MSLKHDNLTSSFWIRVDYVGCFDKLPLRAFDVDTVVRCNAQSGFARIRSWHLLLPIRIAPEVSGAQ